MKVELTLVLKTTERAYGALEAIKRAGYNATVMTSESLRHAVDYYESILGVFIVENDRLEDLKRVIRETTKNFTEIKGFMYSRAIDDFEGSI